MACFFFRNHGKSENHEEKGDVYKRGPHLVVRGRKLKCTIETYEEFLIRTTLLKAVQHSQKDTGPTLSIRVPVSSGAPGVGDCADGHHSLNLQLSLSLKGQTE